MEIANNTIDAFVQIYDNGLAYEPMRSRNEVDEKEQLIIDGESWKENCHCFRPKCKENFLSHEDLWIHIERTHMVEKRKLWQNCVRIVIRELNPLWRLRVSMELERRANPKFGLGVIRISNLFEEKQYSVCEIITKGIACNMCIVPANYNVHCLNKYPEIPHSEK
jgi:hypothetical protein